MRRRMTALWIGIVLLFVSGCGSSEETVAEPAAAAASGDTTESGEPTYVFPSGPEGYMVVDFARQYTSIKELGDDAGAVIIGQVLLQEFEAEQFRNCSYAQVWVEETIIGEVEPGTIITVSEHGIRYGDGTIGTVDCAPLLRAGERVLLFLYDKEEFPDPWKEGYVLINDHQGKFFYHQEEDCWYAAGLLGKNASVPSDAAEPIPDEEMRQLLDRFQKSIDGEAP